MTAKARLFTLWESARVSYWFVPSLMAAASLILGFVMPEVDRAVSDRWMARVDWLYTGSAEGARELLSVIAGSMIGVAGVVFSITIVALTLASNQFGPRLLRNFMRDLSNQVVLGTFIAVFLYCLLILRQVHGENGSLNEFVPQLSMLLAVVLAVAGLGVLIYFIHHMAASIQAPNVVAAVAHDLRNAIDELYPQKLGDAPTDDSANRAVDQVPSDLMEQSTAICADEDGHIQVIEADDLMELASTHDLILKIAHRPGQFLQTGDTVLYAWPSARVSQEVQRDLRHTFDVSAQRTLAQDAEFAVHQLVEVAARALSPGINDPFTAMQCVDRLGAGLSQLAGRVLPPPFRLDGEGRLRVIAYPSTFPKFVDAAFNQIRQDGIRSLAVLIRLLETLGRIAKHARRSEDRTCLREHAAMTYEQAIRAAASERDRQVVKQRYRAVMQALDGTDQVIDQP